MVWYSGTVSSCLCEFDLVGRFTDSYKHSVEQFEIVVCSSLCYIYFFVQLQPSDFYKNIFPKKSQYVSQISSLKQYRFEPTSLGLNFRRLCFVATQQKSSKPCSSLQSRLGAVRIRHRVELQSLDQSEDYINMYWDCQMDITSTTILNNHPQQPSSISSSISSSSSSSSLSSPFFWFVTCTDMHSIS